MVLLIVGTVCFMAGLYAGKKRAAGMSWGDTTRDMASSVYRICASIWRRISYPFRKGDGGQTPERVEPEVV